MNQSRRYSVLAGLQAIMGALIAGVTAAIYFVSPNALKDSSLTIVMAGCGAAVAIYYLSIHQILKKNSLKVSTIILSCLSAINILLVVAATGGLDSPYLALWLLAIVVAGMFGLESTVSALGLTIAYFAYEMGLHSFSKDYIVGHVGLLILALATGLIAEWIHHNLGRNAKADAVTELSGKLSAEALKSDTLIQNVGEGVVVVNSQRQIQLFNPAAERMTGWDAGSAQGIDYRLVLGLRDSAGNKLRDDDDPFELVWQSGKSDVRDDFTMESKNGHKMEISMSLSAMFDSDKNVNGGIALFHDISEEKAVERQRNEFISTASHEMRTPVAAIEGYLSLAMNPSVATIDARAKGYLDKAHDATQHLGELFRDLLSITKMEDNAMAAPDGFFDIGAVVKATVADMKFQADKRGLEIQFSAGDQKVRSEHSITPVYAVKANEQRVREVMMNLIENALKFTSEGSIRVNISGTSDTVTVSVTDSGVGIAKEDIGHLFQKFYRVDSTATRTIGGTGLGLYLCRTIVERAGGKIWVESKLGEGSSFIFSLPRQSADKLEEKPAVQSLAPETKPEPAKKAEAKKPAGVK